MKRIHLLWIALVLAAGANAQDAKVTTGVIAFNDQRFDEAIAKLTEALADPTKLTPKALPKGYYYLSQALMMKCQDTAYVSANPEALFQGEQAWRKTMEVDVKKTYTKTAALTEEKFYGTMFNAGAAAYKEGSEAKKAKNDAVAKTKFAYAARCFEGAARFHPDDDIPPLYQGYAAWELLDTTATINGLSKAMSIYKAGAAKAKPVKPDPTIASANLLLANLYLSRKDTASALSAIEFGRESVKFGSRDSLTPDQRTEIDAADKDLSLTELGIYQNNRKLYQTAKAKFEAAIAANPKDMVVRSAYASLVKENESAEKGLEMFAAILKDDPNNMQANYEFASHYINTAAKLNEQQQKETNDDKLEALQKEIKSLLAKGYPYVRKLHDLEPDNVEWLTQIVGILPYVEGYDTAEWVAFGQKLQAAQAKAAQKK